MRSKVVRCFLALTINVMIVNMVFAQDASREYIEQTGWSIGTNIGKTDLLSNVGPQSFSNLWTNSKYLDHISMMGGLFGRYTVHPCFSVRLMFNYGSVYATDKTCEDLAKADKTGTSIYYIAYARDQTARSLIWDNALFLEFMPKRMNPESEHAAKRGQPYIIAGVSAFHFEPYSTLGNTDTWVRTYDLHVEGEGWGGNFPKQYSRWNWTYSYGLGYKWDLGRHLNLGFECMLHKTHTSYLDGMGEANYVDPRAYAANLSPAQYAQVMQIADKHYILGLEPQAKPGTPRGLTPDGNTHYVDAYFTYSLTFYYKIFAASRQWWR